MNNDRKTGKFVAGNQAARGNGNAKRAARLRKTMLESVTQADMKAAIRALCDEAKGGNIAACKLLLERTLGKVVDPPDLLERLDALEGKLDATSK